MRATSGSLRPVAFAGSVTVVSSGTPSQVRTRPEHWRTPVTFSQLVRPSGTAAVAGAAQRSAGNSASNGVLPFTRDAGYGPPRRGAALREGRRGVSVSE